MRIEFEQKMVSEKSIAGFEPALFNGQVHIQKFCNAISTRPLGTWKGIDVKYTWLCLSKPYMDLELFFIIRKMLYKISKFLS